jgi:excisionase family DNA binding protein
VERKETRLMVRPVEAAHMLSVSRSKIYELINGGSLPAVRLEGGRLIRIPLAALQKLAESGQDNESVGD